MQSLIWTLESTWLLSWCVTSSQTPRKAAAKTEEFLICDCVRALELFDETFLLLDLSVHHLMHFDNHSECALPVVVWVVFC